MKKLLIVTLAALLVLGLGVGSASAWLSGGFAYSGEGEFAGTAAIGGSAFYSVQTTAVAGHGIALAGGAGDECGGFTSSTAWGNDFVSGGQTATVGAGYEFGSLAQAEGAGPCECGRAYLTQDQCVWVDPCDREAGVHQGVYIRGQGDAQTVMYAQIGDEYFDMGSFATGSTSYEADGGQGFHVGPCGIEAGGGQFNSTIIWEYDD